MTTKVLSVLQKAKTIEMLQCLQKYHQCWICWWISNIYHCL